MRVMVKRAAVGGLLLVIVVGAVAYLLRPKTADIEIEVISAGAPVPVVDIFIDDRKVCEASPCRTQVLAGERWVRAVAEGRRDELLLIAEAGEWAELRLELPPLPSARPR